MVLEKTDLSGIPTTEEQHISRTTKSIQFGTVFLGVLRREVKRFSLGTTKLNPSRTAEVDSRSPDSGTLPSGLLHTDYPQRIRRPNGLSSIILRRIETRLPMVKRGN